MNSEFSFKKNEKHFHRRYFIELEEISVLLEKFQIYIA